MRGVWWAAVYGITQSRTRLKRLSSSMLGSQGLLGGSVIKNLLANAEMPESWVQSLGQEDLLEETMAALSSILAWIILMTEEAGKL